MIGGDRYPPGRLLGVRVDSVEAPVTLPLWMLLGFATWTVLLLLATVGIYRWSRIITGRVPISEFRADRVEGDEWYKRSMRAHANCVENLPVFGAIVFALYAARLESPTIDALATAVLAARIVQSLIHVCLVQSDAVVSVRFTFFLVQVISYLWLIALIVTRAGASASP